MGWGSAHASSTLCGNFLSHPARMSHACMRDEETATPQGRRRDDAESIEGSACTCIYRIHANALERALRVFVCSRHSFVIYFPHRQHAINIISLLLLSFIRSYRVVLQTHLVRAIYRRSGGNAFSYLIVLYNTKMFVHETISL